MRHQAIRKVFQENKFHRGTFVLVDGQFGSTGKGLMASVFAEAVVDLFDVVTSSAGPNSGHTSYWGDEKIVLKQLPTFAVIAKKLGYSLTTHMNDGAVIDPKIIEEEVHKYDMWGHTSISPFAAVASDDERNIEKGLIQDVGSTGKGTGAAIARKVMRDTEGVFGRHPEPCNVQTRSVVIAPHDNVFIEVSQGFSLGINQGFYPFCTSRECTVMQALSDAGIHPSMYTGCAAVYRTFPIRVAGNSGPVYNDQVEMSWKDLGVKPEVTTVTQKVRRVFTFSNRQYKASLLANRPDVLCFNFLNYLNPDERMPWVDEKVRIYRTVLRKSPKLVLMGNGPRIEDVTVFNA